MADLLRQIPNFLSILRGIGALVMLCHRLSGASLWTVYAVCGLSDMLDGALARKFCWESRIGARIDSFADLLFCGAAFYRFLPLLPIPGWLWWVGGAIAFLKILNLAVGWLRRGKPVFLHSRANRLTGLLLFLLPLSLLCDWFGVCLIPVTGAAAFAAVQEGYLIIKEPKGKEYEDYP